MSMTVECPTCRSRVTVPDHVAGKKTKCPKCRNLMMLPDRPAAPEADEPVETYDVSDEQPPPRKRARKPPQAMKHEWDVLGGEESRSYTHTRCGESTLATGFACSMLCNPFGPCIGTLCTTCAEHFPLEEFDWDDTGENIARSRRRLARKAPGWMRLLLSRSGCLLVMLPYALIGAALGYGGFRLLNWNHWIGLGLGALAGMIASTLMLTIVQKMLLEKYYGVSEVWELR